jgi:hypothetical protein
MVDAAGSDDDEPDSFARHRMRIITVSAENRITADTLQPWSSVAVTSAFTGESVGFPAAEIPSGALERHTDGREVLLTVDGLTLHLDGEGGLVAYDEAGQALDGPGIFMIVETVDD